MTITEFIKKKILKKKNGMEYSTSRIYQLYKAGRLTNTHEIEGHLYFSEQTKIIPSGKITGKKLGGKNNERKE